MAEAQPKTYRITLDVPDSTKQHLKKLQSLIGYTKRVDVFRTAFDILDYLAHELARGNKIIVETPDGNEKEIVFPFRVNKDALKDEE